VDIDAAGNATHYSFADSWADAHCAPAGQSASFLTSVTNALGQSEHATYNSCSGAMATATDANNNTTSFSYSDPGHLDRLTQVNFPDGGITTYAYADHHRDQAPAGRHRRHLDGPPRHDGRPRPPHRQRHRNHRRPVVPH